MSAYLDLFNAGPSRKIEFIRACVKRTSLRTLARKLGISESLLVKDLGVCPGSSPRFGKAASERVIGLMSLIGRVESLIAKSGVVDFDAAKWVGKWLDEPLPALGGARPGSYLDTMAGLDLLGDLIAMTESGAYA